MTTMAARPNSVTAFQRKGPAPNRNKYTTLRTAPDSETMSLDELVEVLFDEWERETTHLSSPAATMRHDAFRGIVQLGGKAVQPLLRIYRKRDGFVALVLSEITGHNPVAPQDRGNMKAVRKAWLAWDRSNALRSQSFPANLSAARAASSRTDQLVPQKPVL